MNVRVNWLVFCNFKVVIRMFWIHIFGNTFFWFHIFRYILMFWIRHAFGHRYQLSLPLINIIIIIIIHLFDQKFYFMYSNNWALQCLINEINNNNNNNNIDHNKYCISYFNFVWYIWCLWYLQWRWWYWFRWFWLKTLIKLNC